MRVFHALCAASRVFLSAAAVAVAVALASLVAAAATTDRRAVPRRPPTGVRVEPSSRRRWAAAEWVEHAVTRLRRAHRRRRGGGYRAIFAERDSARGCACARATLTRLITPPSTDIERVLFAERRLLLLLFSSTDAAETHLHAAVHRVRAAAAAARAASLAAQGRFPNRRRVLPGGSVQAFGDADGDGRRAALLVLHVGRSVRWRRGAGQCQHRGQG